MLTRRALLGTTSALAVFLSGAGDADAWLLGRRPHGRGLTAVVPQILGIALSSSSVVANAPAGTIVGVISVQMSTGSFTGTLSLGTGGQSSNFAIANGNQLVTSASLSQGTESVQIIATQPGASQSPFQVAKDIIVTPSSSALAVTLNFADGKTLFFSQDQATELDSYISPYVQQRNLRQRGTGHGDYRDSFTVFFRPEVDGTRDEVVVEYGTEHIFAAGAAPLTLSGQTPQHLYVPPSPSFGTNVTGDTSGYTGTPTVYLTYVMSPGETVSPVGLGHTLKAGERLVVHSPPAFGGAIGWNVYVKLNRGPTIDGPFDNYQQNSAPIPIGTDWTQPTTGLLDSTNTLVDAPGFDAYTATISGGGLAQPVTLTVPAHFWGTRWRWQSVQRPIIRTLADLVAMKALPPYSIQSVWNSPPFTSTITWDGPMSAGGLNTSLAAQGDRDELGFITEWQAQYLLIGGPDHPNLEVSMRSQAEASGSLPYHVRDAATSAPFSVQQYPYIGQYKNAGNPGFGIGNPVHVRAPTIYFTITEGVAHMPSCARIPWLLTDDPFFLEEAQFCANYCMTESNFNQIQYDLPGLVLAEARGVAWGMREIFTMAAFTPDPPPSWLQPRSYWNQNVADNLNYANRFLNQTIGPYTTVFHMYPFTAVYQTYMQDYIGSVYGWAGWTGFFPEWADVINYTAQIRLATCDPTDASGWDHRYPMPYMVPVWKADLGKSAPTVTKDYTFVDTTSTPLSWAALWADYQIKASLDPSTFLPDTIVNEQLAYMSEAIGAAAAWVLAGVPKMRATYDWLFNQEVVNVAPARRISHYKWAIWPN